MSEIVVFLPIAIALFGFNSVIAWAFWEGELEHLKWRKRMEQRIAEAQDRLRATDIKEG